MQSRMPKATIILPEAMQPLLEAKPNQSRPPAPGFACVGHKRTKDQHPPEGVRMSVSGRLRARTGMLVMAGVCLLGATPASAAGGTGIGAGRLVPAVAAVVGLIGVVFGGLALAGSGGRIGTGNGRRGAIIAAGVAGLISVVVGGLHAANSAGGFGTGNGLAGAIVAMLVGLISMALGGLTLARSRRTAGRLTG
jgi:Family of unknown function (DUF6223)